MKDSTRIQAELDTARRVVDSLKERNGELETALNVALDAVSALRAKLNAAEASAVENRRTAKAPKNVDTSKN